MINSSVMIALRITRQKRAVRVRWCFRFLIIFGFLFNINLIPHVSSTNICSLIAIVYLFFHKKAVSRTLSLFRGSLGHFYILASLCVFICLINSALYPSNSGIVDELKLGRLIPIYIQVIAFSLFCLVEFSKFEGFAKIMICIFCVQVVAVFFSVINPEFRMFLYEHFYFGDDRFDNTVMIGTRFMGIALNSSSGSVICSIIIAVLCGMKVCDKIKDRVFWLLVWLFMTMTLFIGRIGVLVEIGMLASILIFGKNKINSLLFVGILMVLLLISINLILFQVDSDIAELIRTWMSNPYSEEGRESTLSGINVHMPSFSKELLFGTNVMRGRLPFGDYVQSDSGYVKMYCALGIVGSLLYYSAYWLILSSGISCLPRKVKYYVYVMICLAFIIEYKQPFFLMSSFTWAILTIGLFLKREYRREKCISGFMRAD